MVLPFFCISSHFNLILLCLSLTNPNPSPSPSIHTCSLTYVLVTSLVHSINRPSASSSCMFEEDPRFVQVESFVILLLSWPTSSSGRKRSVSVSSSSVCVSHHFSILNFYVTFWSCTLEKLLSLHQPRGRKSPSQVALNFSLRPLWLSPRTPHF